MKCLTLFFVLIAGASAYANPTFYNATTNEYNVRITQPNGEKADHALSPGASYLGSVSCWMLDSVKTFPYEVLSAGGEVIARGQGQNHTSYVLTPDQKVLEAGGYSDKTPPKISLLIDLTGQMKANFLGDAKVDAQRGLSFPKEFDRTRPFRFHPKEDSYTVELVDAQGNVHKPNVRFPPGSHAVIFMNSLGVPSIDFTGTIR